MGTTPHVPIPDAAHDASGVISMGPILEELVPDVAAQCATYFTHFGSDVLDECPVIAGSCHASSCFVGH